MATLSIETIRGYGIRCIIVPLLLGFTPGVSVADDSIVPISQSLCDDMKAQGVLTPGAPVDCTRLSLIKFAYFGFDGRVHGDGEIVVMDAAAENVLRIFSKLRDNHFPIAKARLMNHYRGNDDASMADNNTSAFNARPIVGGKSFSLHAYGLAIDLNPIQNPYAKRSGATLIFNPPAGAQYANRRNDRPWKNFRPGMAEPVVEVFAEEGFVLWGGYWDGPIDYQHFQVSRTIAEQLARLPPAEARAVFQQHVERYRACRINTPEEAGRSQCIMTDPENRKS